MFGSHVLETFAGLAFIYLLLCVFASTINEWVAAVLSSRAKALERALRNLLAEDVSPVPAGAAPNPASGQGVATALLGHSLIQNLCAPNLLGTAITSPAYLSAKSFSSALFDLLQPRETKETTPTFASLRSSIVAMSNQDLKKALLPLIDKAAGNLEQARKNVEDWYDAAMDRLSGFYKRRTQVALFIIGLIMAVFLNVDTIRATKKLWTDPVLREHMLEQARKQPAPAIATASVDVTAAAQNAIDAGRNVSALYSSKEFPAGWTDDAKSIWASKPGSDLQLWPILLVLAGWFLTAIAITLGAPFWFDLLNKTLNLNTRLNGATPTRSST